MPSCIQGADFNQRYAGAGTTMVKDRATQPINQCIHLSVCLSICLSFICHLLGVLETWSLYYTYSRDPEMCFCDNVHVFEWTCLLTLTKCTCISQSCDHVCSRCVQLTILIYIYIQCIYIYIHTSSVDTVSIPVVPHKAVAEVSE